MYYRINTKKYKYEFIKKYGLNVPPFIGSKESGDLTRWFKEEWRDVADLPYPVYRPTKIIDEITPLTVYEIDPKNLVSQSLLKQRIKGKKNLPPFKGL